MRSLKKLNAAAGTGYTRRKQVAEALRGEELGAAATPQTVPGSRPGSPEQPQGRECKMPWWAG